MQLFRDVAVALAIVLGAFAFYEAKLKPIYVCDIQGIVRDYVDDLKRSNMSYRDKEAKLEDFMYKLRQVLNSYGVVYNKGSVTGSRVRDITREVRNKLTQKGWR